MKGGRGRSKKYRVRMCVLRKKDEEEDVGGRWGFYREKFGVGLGGQVAGRLRAVVENSRVQYVCAMAAQPEIQQAMKPVARLRAMKE